MTRRKGPRKRLVSKPGRGKDPAESLSSRVSLALQQGRYKDALVTLKSLRKQNDTPEIRRDLAIAYAGRAIDLAKKGLFCEAAAIWEQRAESCKVPLASPCYLVWLIHAERPAEAVTLLAENSTAFEAAGQLKTLREHLAALALAGCDALLAALPADDTLVRDHARATALLEAWCDGDDAAVEASLKAIPYRSPYRDFRQLIKALRDPLAVDAEALARIDEHSAFRPLADILSNAYVQGATRPMAERALALAQTSATENLCHEIQGYSTAQLACLKDAIAQGPAPSPRALFNLMMRHQTLFHGAEARRIALRLLVHFPNGQKAFAKAFGKLATHETAWLAALRAEDKQDPLAMDAAWIKAARALEHVPDMPDSRLRCAVILRHLVAHWSKPALDQPDRAQHLLEMAVAADPENVPTQAQLVAFCRNRGDLPAARAALKSALALHPAAIDLQLEAVQTALAGNSFKKAAGHARKVLETDPVNVTVQQLLLDAHLAHTRKQIKSGKFELAERELEQAAQWARSSENKGRVALVRGLMACDMGNHSTGQAQLRAGVAYFGGSLVGLFEAMLEGLRQRQFCLAVLRKIDLPQTLKTRDPAAVLDLMHAFSSCENLKRDWIVQLMHPFADSVHQAATHAYSHTDLEFICEALHRLRQFTLLERYAKNGSRRYPEQPVYVYHEVYARNNGESVMLDDVDMQQFDQAIDAAEASGDHRTRHRIIDFVQRGMSFGNPFGHALDDDEELMPPELSEFLENADPNEVEAMFRDLANAMGNAGFPDGMDEPGSAPRRRKAKKKGKSARSRLSSLFGL